MMRLTGDNPLPSCPFRAIKPTAQSRRGAMLVATLACMAIVMGIIGVMLQGALRARRQMHAERDLRQACLLADAALDRAATRLASDEGYDGETWRIPAEQLLNAGDGEVVIAVHQRRDADDWSVRVAAEYPAGEATSVRRTRTFTVKKTEIENIQ